jgi:hypothetical protein
MAVSVDRCSGLRTATSLSAARRTCKEFRDTVSTSSRSSTDSRPWRPTLAWSPLAPLTGTREASRMALMRPNAHGSCHRELGSSTSMTLLLWAARSLPLRLRLGSGAARSASFVLGAKEARSWRSRRRGTSALAGKSYDGAWPAPSSVGPSGAGEAGSSARRSVAASSCCAGRSGIRLNTHKQDQQGAGQQQSE